MTISTIDRRFIYSTSPSFITIARRYAWILCLDSYPFDGKMSSNCGGKKGVKNGWKSKHYDKLMLMVFPTVFTTFSVVFWSM